MVAAREEWSASGLGIGERNPRGGGGKREREAAEGRVERKPIWIGEGGLVGEGREVRGERETMDRGTEGECGRLRSTTGGDPWAAS